MGKRFHLSWFGTPGPGGDAGNWMRTGNDYDWRYPEIYRDIANACERACFDMVVFADGLAVPDSYQGRMDHYLRVGAWTPNHDPNPILGMLSATTSRIGMVTTIPTTLTYPYSTARLLSSLDHFSRGRVGWNVVTAVQSQAAQNLGMDDLPDHDHRYDIADEYMALCHALWSSWDADALVMDRQRKIFADPSKVRLTQFEGTYYKSRGPLSVPPSPQGTPVIVSAGSSPRGRRFAAEHSELTIVTSRTEAALAAFVTDFRRRLVEAGRAPNACKVFCLVKPTLGETRAIAEAKQKWQIEQMDVETGVATMSMYMGQDLSVYDLDQPLPELDVNAMRSKFTSYYENGNPTLREIAMKEMRYDGYSLVGSPDEVASEMERLVEKTGVDGFLLRPALQNFTDVIEFVDKVVPLLQERGSVRREYSGDTLRHHLSEF